MDYFAHLDGLRTEPHKAAAKYEWHKMQGPCLPLVTSEHASCPLSHKLRLIEKGVYIGNSYVPQDQIVDAVFPLVFFDVPGALFPQLFIAVTTLNVLKEFNAIGFPCLTHPLPILSPFNFYLFFLTTTKN